MKNNDANLLSAPLQGGQLIIAGILLALANFLVILDTTIANVAVPHIAGGLAVSPTQGTYVITSYAVAEAIMVPLTGWLSSRFGLVRVFISSMIMFGLFSILCGLANSIVMLSVFRVFQGLSGGPLMPLSQTLLLKVFPKEKAAAAIGLWSMTTLVAPIMGPILGGWLCDEIGWPAIFYINIPIAIICSFLCYKLLRRYESAITKVRIDIIGLILLVVWVGAFQIMLDEGKSLDWFESNIIISLAIVASIGFVIFVIWELTDKHPIVDLKVFRHRGFSISVLNVSLAFGAFFGSIVLMPLWLQNYMGYTAGWSGFATAGTGVLAVFAAPFAAYLSTKVDPRKLVFFGVMWMGCATLFRSFSTTEMTYAQIALPILIQGLGMPFFFVPLTGLALSSVLESEIALASGLMNFVRTLSGAFAVSVFTTSWEHRASYNHSELAGLVDRTGQNLQAIKQLGFSKEQGIAMIDHLVQGQSIMLSTNEIFFASFFVFLLAACVIWLAPKPNKIATIPQGH